MDKNLHNIDKLFLKSLKGYREEPSGGVWSSVENALDREDAKKYKRKYKNLKTIAVCSMLFCLLTASGVLLNHIYSLKREGTVNSSLKTMPPLLTDSTKETSKGTNSNSQTSQLTKKELLNSQMNILKPGLYETNKNVILNTNEMGVDSLQEVNPNYKSPLLSSRNIDSISAESTPSVKYSFSTTGNFSENTTKDSLSEKVLSEAKLRRPARNFYLIPFLSYDMVTARLKEEYIYDNQAESAMSDREKPDISFTFGIHAEYQLTKKISLQSGISISNLYTSIEPTVVRAVQDNSGTYKFKLATTYGLAEIKKTGIANPQTGDSINVNDASMGLQYLSVPICIKTPIKQGRLNINGTAGISVNRIMSEKMEVDYFSDGNKLETINNIEGLKKSFITLIAGAEVNYSLNNNISLGLGPVMRYSLTAVNEHVPIKAYPVNLGAAALVKIKL